MLDSTIQYYFVVLEFRIEGCTQGPWCGVPIMA